MMNNKGQQAISTINALILVVIVAVLIVAVLTQFRDRFDLFGTQQHLKAEYDLCKSNFKRYADTPSLQLDSVDADRDSCATGMDKCELTAGFVAEKLDMSEENYMRDYTLPERMALQGHDMMDTDGDGWSDVCDPEPNKASRNCLLGPDEKKCTSSTDMLRSAMSGAQWNAQLQVVQGNIRRQTMGGQRVPEQGWLT